MPQSAGGEPSCLKAWRMRSLCVPLYSCPRKTLKGFITQPVAAICASARIAMQSAKQQKSPGLGQWDAHMRTKRCMISLSLSLSLSLAPHTQHLASEINTINKSDTPHMVDTFRILAYRTPQSFRISHIAFRTSYITRLFALRTPRSLSHIAFRTSYITRQFALRTPRSLRRSMAP